MKILFQGDSITDAFRKPEEINPAYQLGNGYAFLVAAHLGAQYPDRRFEFINRGVSGQAVQHLAERWQTDALDVQPDLLSLLVGVNNILRRNNGQPDIPDAGFLELYRGLLDQLLAQNPHVRFLLIEPFLLQAGTVTEEMSASFRPIQKGIAAIASDFDAPFIPLQSIFDRVLSRAPAAYWAYDGIHPTHAGFQLITEAWLRTAESHQLLTPVA
ncbi:MAG: SGNH/GDSL hydrolase family protein [Verrucomicrobia bacterium]|nr:SGNH/GDSL hydrolase family protein [Verrucomicrobiota bacterium]